MTEETKVVEATEVIETKQKKSFKERCKKILPWIGAGAVTVGMTIVGYKFGRKMTELDENSIIGHYLDDTMKKVSMGMEHAVHLTEDNGDEFWMGMQKIDKPDWWDSSLDGNSAIIVSEVAQKIGK